MMSKIDFKKAHPDLFQPSAKDFTLIDIPAMKFVMVDGEGNPNTTPAYQHAVEWLFS